MCTYLNPCLMFLASRCTMHTERIPNKDESSIADVQLGSKCATKYRHLCCDSSGNLSAI